MCHLLVFFYETQWEDSLVINKMQWDKIQLITEFYLPFELLTTKLFITVIIKGQEWFLVSIITIINPENKFIIIMHTVV